MTWNASLAHEDKSLQAIMPKGSQMLIENEDVADDVFSLWFFAIKIEEVYKDTWSQELRWDVKSQSNITGAAISCSKMEGMHPVCHGKVGASTWTASLQ